MSSYLDTIIAPGEHIVYVGKLSMFSIAGAISGGVMLIALGAVVAVMANPLVGALVGVAGLLILAGGLVRRASTEVAVTNRRIIVKHGFIRRDTIEMALNKVESVRVEQSVMGRLLDYGSIIVVGTGSTLDPITFIARPIQFRQALQAATDGNN
ncbi:MAG TPA: PH domain-containing protein [Gemmatimonadaceae bacterium]|nr:PH domain-containing protein [Gemmatimonadaceae bacterium]